MDSTPIHAYASRAQFLSKEERELVPFRMRVDPSPVADERFSSKDSVKVFKMTVALVWLSIELCLEVPLRSVSLFPPQIVGRL